MKCTQSVRCFALSCLAGCFFLYALWFIRVKIALMFDLRKLKYYHTTNDGLVRLKLVCLSRMWNLNNLINNNSITAAAYLFSFIQKWIHLWLSVFIFHTLQTKTPFFRGGKITYAFLKPTTVCTRISFVILGFALIQI